MGYNHILLYVCSEMFWLALTHYHLSSQAIENSSFKTVEAMAQQVASTTLQGVEFDEVIVRVEKPSAMAFVGYSGVEIRRVRRDFHQP